MKKRIFTVLLCIASVVAVCVFSLRFISQKKKEAQLQKLAVPPSFCAQVRMEYGGTEYLCNIQKDGDLLKLLVEEPQRLKGVEAAITRENYMLMFMGMEIDGSRLPEGMRAAMDAVFSFLDKLESNEYSEYSETEQLITLDYALGNTEFSCSYDKLSGIPKEITVNELFSIEFLQFSVI